ncbi:cytochrome C [Desulfonema ishimotonii]|uniref:Cytochrome C n=1 Tax=Desulfonema ishimotonii TaxID=45657 RepID=A0A401G476_9BACT|nr:menaquinone reductase multiheme cytochrome c subunit QrcA [Desulfonema ishimotonii]GBC64001.1 cytochrome C [Desulfonema ishimotonii]
MSALEEKTKEVSEGGGFTMLFFIIGLVVSLIFGWVVFPELLYSQKKQPFDFNHALHSELVDEGCESCHFFREDGSYAGVPQLAQCVGCHEDVQGETEDEAIFVNEYVKTGQEVPWLVYSRQPDCVFFSHVAHVKTAGMDCQTCHGDIGQSTSLKVYEENRITGYSRDIWGKNIAGFKTHTWDRMKMDDCSECHVNLGVKQASVQTGKGACFVCHK